MKDVRKRLTKELVEVAMEMEHRAKTNESGDTKYWFRSWDDLCQITRENISFLQRINPEND